MIKKHSIFFGIILALIFLIISTQFYPGGSYVDEFSKGYDWTNNYISNLLQPISVNGEANPARPWAIVGVLFLTASFGVFFVDFSGKIKIRSVVFVIKYFGILATVFGFLTVVPFLHDIMVTVSSILTLIIFFYITVILIKSKLVVLKILSILFLLIFYLGAYMYFTRYVLEYMPLMQKIIFSVKIIWVLSLIYFTEKEDFQHIIK
jgi:hypothetical protein